LPLLPNRFTLAVWHGGFVPRQWSPFSLFLSLPDPSLDTVQKWRGTPFCFFATVVFTALTGDLPIPPLPSWVFRFPSYTSRGPLCLLCSFFFPVFCFCFPSSSAILPRKLLAPPLFTGPFGPLLLALQPRVFCFLDFYFSLFR